MSPGSKTESPKQAFVVGNGGGVEFRKHFGHSTKLNVNILARSYQVH